MKKVLFSIAILAFFAGPALADEFGSRFGNNSPYALQNTVSNATMDTQGIGLEDLNDIAPAAGGIDTPDAEIPEDAENVEGAAPVSDEAANTEPTETPKP